MNKFFKLILAVLIIFSSTITAENFFYQEVQVMTYLNKEVPIVKDRLSFHGSFVYFYTLVNNKELSLTYAGLAYKPTKWLWIAPHIGAVEHWTDDGNDAFLLSLWTRMSFSHNRFILSFQNDTYFGYNQRDYYGIYSFDSYLSKQKNIGFHIEQINTTMMFGPHIGFTNGNIHSEIQYYFGSQNRNYGHNVRFLINLNF